MSGEAAGKGIRFSPTIELGHLLQAAVLLVAAGGWAIGGYQLIQKQLDAQQSEVALVKQRMTAEEATEADDRAVERSNADETRTQLSKIIDQMADLRTLVAAQGRDAPHR